MAAASEETMPRIVIVGGGFGGLAAVKALRHTPAEIILLDNVNHHLFQPLLYQVATSELSSAQIASPLRWILRNQKNVTVIQADVTGVDPEGKRVFAGDADRKNVPTAYDYLILATGASHSYFGHDKVEKFAPGLKSLADAEAIRNKILLAFERAEAEDDPILRRAFLTFVLVGAGPTGVEMSGAIAELVRGTLKSEFRPIDTASARVMLVDMGPRILAIFSEKLSWAATRHLQKLGVEILLRRSVDQVDAARRDFRGWGHDVPRQIRQAAAGRCPGGDPAGAVLRNGDSASHCRPTRHTRVPLFRQGKPGRGGQTLRHIANPQSPAQRTHRVVRMGRSASAVPDDIRSPFERLSSMGLDLSHRAARVPVDRRAARGVGWEARG
jgi:hypothetical protein